MNELTETIKQLMELGFTKEEAAKLALETINSKTKTTTAPSGNTLENFVTTASCATKNMLKDEECKRKLKTSVKALGFYLGFKALGNLTACDVFDFVADAGASAAMVSLGYNATTSAARGVALVTEEQKEDYREVILKNSNNSNTRKSKFSF